MNDPLFVDNIATIGAAAIDFLIIWYFVQKLTGKRHD